MSEFMLPAAETAQKALNKKKEERIQIIRKFLFFSSFPLYCDNEVGAAATP